MLFGTVLGSCTTAHMGSPKVIQLKFWLHNLDELTFQWCHFHVVWCCFDGVTVRTGNPAMPQGTKTQGGEQRHKAGNKDTGWGTKTWGGESRKFGGGQLVFRFEWSDHDAAATFGNRVENQWFEYWTQMDLDSENPFALWNLFLQLPIHHAFKYDMQLQCWTNLCADKVTFTLLQYSKENDRNNQKATATGPPLEEHLNHTSWCSSRTTRLLPLWHHRMCEVPVQWPQLLGWYAVQGSWALWTWGSRQTCG